MLFTFKKKKKKKITYKNFILFIFFFPLDFV